jgi:hypothetical protein
LAVSLMVMLPAVSAAEATVSQSATSSRYLLNLKDTYLAALQTKYKDSPSPQCIIITLLIMFLKLMRWGIILGVGVILLILLGIGGHGNNTTAVL